MPDLTILPIANCLLTKRTKMLIVNKYCDLIKVGRYLNVESNGVTYGANLVCIALDFIENWKPRFSQKHVYFCHILAEYINKYNTIGSWLLFGLLFAVLSQFAIAKCQFFEILWKSSPNHKDFWEPNSVLIPEIFD